MKNKRRKNSKRKNKRTREQTKRRKREKDRKRGRMGEKTQKQKPQRKQHSKYGKGNDSPAKPMIQLRQYNFFPGKRGREGGKGSGGQNAPVGPGAGRCPVLRARGPADRRVKGKHAGIGSGQGGDGVQRFLLSLLFPCSFPGAGTRGRTEARQRFPRGFSTLNPRGESGAPGSALAP